MKEIEINDKTEERKNDGILLEWVFGTQEYASCLLWLISRIFSANEQYFSLTQNQPTILLAMSYQPNKSKRTGRKLSNVQTRHK